MIQEPDHGIVIHSRNPFMPTRDRVTYSVEEPVSVAEFVRSRHLDLRLPTICFYEGEVITRAEWESSMICPGTRTVFMSLPAGKGSNPLRILAMIAVIVLAVWTGGTFGPQLLPGLTPAVAQGIVTGIVGFIGSALVSIMLPPPKPTSSMSNAALAAPSPTYNIAAQGNRARIGEPIPVIYGRHIIYPDFAASPYVEYRGNEAYLFQLFCIGQGHFDIEQIFVEDTPIANFEEVTTEIVAPGAAVTLFPANVITDQNVSQVALNTQNVYSSTFVVVPTDVAANRIAVDVWLPRGLYSIYVANGMMVNQSVSFVFEYQQIDDLGSVLGPWTQFTNTTLTAATPTVQRHTFESPLLTPGRYQVRAKRTSAKSTDNYTGDEVEWIGARCYVPGDQLYGNVTMLAMKIRATGQMSGLSSRKINAVVTRKLPTWSKAGGWSAVTATTNPAWAIADIWKNPDYALGKTDSTLNLEQLEALAAVWAARGDKFNGIFDSAISAWEALKTVARVGRAQPFVHGGVLQVVRDAPETLPSGFFSTRNIAKGSLAVTYIMPTEETADAVEFEYFDEDVWKWRRVTCALPASQAQKPVRLPQIIGITNRAQAFREGVYIAASNKYRRKVIQFRTELEGHIVAPGGLVLVSHDVPSWGVSGDVTEVSGSNGTALLPNAQVTLSEPVVFSTGDHYIVFRGPDGSSHGPYRCLAGSAENVVVLPDGAQFAPQLNLNYGERTHFMFGKGTTYCQQARVVNIRPSASGVDVVCVNEAPEVHTADGGTVPPPDEQFGPPASPDLPVIPAGSLVAVQVGSQAAPEVALSWGAAPGAEKYLIEESVDNIAWSAVSETTLTHFQLRTTIGWHYFRVAPVGVRRGAWVSVSIQVVGAADAPVAPPQLTNLIAVASLNSIYVTWTDPNYGFTARIEIWSSVDSNFANAVLRATVVYPTVVWVDELGAQGITRYYWVRLVTGSTPGALSGPVSATTGGAVVNIGAAENMVWNPELRSGLEFWGWDTLPPGWGVSRQLAGWTLTGTGTGYLYQPDGAQTSIAVYPSQSTAYPKELDACVPDAFYEASCWVGVHRCNCAIVFRFYNSAHTLIQEVIASAAEGRCLSSEGKTGGVNLSGYKRIYSIVQAPSTAAYFTAGIHKYGTLAGSNPLNSYLFWTRMLVGEARAEQTLPSPYGGAIGSTPAGWLAGKIQGTQINDQAIGTPHLVANCVTAQIIAANVVGADHVVAGAVTAKHVGANEIVTTSGNIRALTVSTLHIQGQAVTVPVAVSAVDTLTMANLSYNGFGTYYGVILTVPAMYLPESVPVFVTALISFDMTSSLRVPCNIHMLRNGGSLGYVQPGTVRVQNVTVPYTISYELRGHFPVEFVDYPGAGSHTYQVYVEILSPGSPAYIGRRSASAVGYRK